MSAYRRRECSSPKFPLRKPGVREDWCKSTLDTSRKNEEGVTNNSTRPNMSYYKLYRKLLVSLLRHAKKWPASRLADRHASLVALPFILTCDMLPASVWRIAAISVSTMGDGSAYPGLPGTGGLNWGRLPGRHEKRGFATISAIWCEATKKTSRSARAAWRPAADPGIPQLLVAHAVPHLPGRVPLICQRGGGMPPLTSSRRLP